jgi:hypothetical protein
MAEPPDFYFESFEINGHGNGVIISFKKDTPGRKPEIESYGRSSYETLKILTFTLQRFVKQVERDKGVIYPIAVKHLNDLKISPDDWNDFWKPNSNPQL